MFFTAHAWPRLQELVLSSTRLSGGLGALAGAELPALRELDMLSSELSGDDIRGFARRAKMPALRLLRLSHNKLGPDAAEALTGAAWPDLEALDLDCCGLESKGAALLRGVAQAPAAEPRLQWVWAQRGPVLSPSRVFTPG